MKKAYLIIITILSAGLGAMAQPTLTSVNFSPNIGDSQLFYVADSNSVIDNTTGANVIFDYSGLRGYGQTQTQYIVDPTTTQFTLDFLGSTVTDTTSGFPINKNYSQLFGTDSLTKTGIVANITTYGTVIVKYNQDPEISMKFPFNFGNNYTDNYAGVLTVQGVNTNGLGTATVNADAWGTLILPTGASIDSVLRVKTTENLITDTIVLIFPPLTILPIVINAEYVNYYKPSISKFPLISFINGTYTQDNNILDSTKIVISQYPMFTVGVEELNSTIKASLFPNPTNKDFTTLTFNLENKANVNVTVFNNLGQNVKEVFNGKLQQGKNNLKIQTSSLSKGLYFININVNDKTTTKKLVIK
ncbi:MAG: T9SS type A sorting domain-containing protein [Flavobacteriales bacterium]|nr:T9SS type A sorting domain-containing protein [Flavobacteriales bacterium]